MQAILPSFPAFFAQSPCSPANIVPPANAPATTSAMSLVIVEAQTAAAAWSFKRSAYVTRNAGSQQLPHIDSAIETKESECRSRSCGGMLFLIVSRLNPTYDRAQRNYSTAS